MPRVHPPYGSRRDVSGRRSTLYNTTCRSGLGPWHRRGGVVGGGVIGLARSRRRASDRMRPSRDYTSSIRFHLIRKIPPVREDSTRSEGVDSFRSGVSPHRQQASSRNSPTRPLCQRGPPRFVATPAVNTVPDAQQGLAGQPCASEGACTRGNGGGFAPLEASCRRVAGVSRLYWCNSPRLVAVRSRFGAVWRPHRRSPRRQTPTMGCRGRGGLHCGHNDAWPRVELAREPAIASANQLSRT